MITQSATELLEQEQLQVHQQIAQAESLEDHKPEMEPKLSVEELDRQIREQAAELQQSETDPSAQD